MMRILCLIEATLFITFLINHASAQDADSIGVSDSLQHQADSRVTPSMDSPEIEYRLLATTRTSTLERELNEAADAGYRLEGMIGGSTAFGGNETVALMSRSVDNPPAPRYQYKTLATNRTSTMQSELQEAGEAGYLFRAQTVMETTFGGKEVVIVTERDADAFAASYEYRLLATSRTSTMQEELLEAGEEGFSFAGVTVAETLMGGDEVVVITVRPRPLE